MLSLAAMQLRNDSVVWDVGAASGSVAIEAALIAAGGTVWAIECDAEGVAHAEENARNHGADNVRVIHGMAPDALAELPAPDAVFVGGSKGSLAAIIERAVLALRPGGRLVVNAITMESVQQAHDAFKAHAITPEVTLVNISRAVPLARYLRYEALNPIHIFAADKPRNAKGSS